MIAVTEVEMWKNQKFESKVNAPQVIASTTYLPTWASQQYMAERPSNLAQSSQPGEVRNEPKSKNTRNRFKHDT